MPNRLPRTAMRDLAFISPIPGNPSNRRSRSLPVVAPDQTLAASSS
jgi:hypothetical protein